MRGAARSTGRPTAAPTTSGCRCGSRGRASRDPRRARDRRAGLRRLPRLDAEPRLRRRPSACSPSACTLHGATVRGRRAALPALARRHPVGRPEAGDRMTWQLRRAARRRPRRDHGARDRAPSRPTPGRRRSMRAELAEPTHLVPRRASAPSRRRASSATRGCSRRGARGRRHPDHRGRASARRRQGLGRTLMQRPDRRGAQARRAARSSSRCAPTTPAPRPLRALGFEEIAVRAGYYQPDDVDAHRDATAHCRTRDRRAPR